MPGTDGSLYGTTSQGGNESCATSAFGPLGCGTVFRITPEGALTTQHRFDGTDGAEGVNCAPVQATNGIFYGATTLDGANGDGTLFSLSIGLRPFVETVPASGKVGEQIDILGSDLAAATGVTFNGTAAAFTVASGTLIEATVPPGATSGEVEVVIPAGTLRSNTTFYVRE